jgi:hypothetical protein
MLLEQSFQKRVQKMNVLLKKFDKTLFHYLGGDFVGALKCE